MKHSAIFLISSRPWFLVSTTRPAQTFHIVRMALLTRSQPMQIQTQMELSTHTSDIATSSSGLSHRNQGIFACHAIPNPIHAVT